jgi:hypothetical protein
MKFSLVEVYQPGIFYEFVIDIAGGRRQEAEGRR